jgi:stage III sporulation protein AA
MGPAVVISDELGREDDAIAVKEALHAGVSVIASVHGCSMEDIGRRPYVGDLVRQKMFERYVVIGDNPVIGTIEAIIGTSGEVLYSFKKEVRECG